jgi:hypothetical protein
MLRNRRFRWPVHTFLAHTVFVFMVTIADRSPIVNLRYLQQQFVDRPAFELWWWLQNTYPRTLADLTFPIAKTLGFHLFSELSWLVWCCTVGSIPYMTAAALLAQIAETRRSPPAPSGA